MSGTRWTASGRRLRRLAQEQTTFWKLATLVARGATAAELFTAFTGQIGRLLPGDHVALGRFQPDGALIPVAAWARAGESHTDQAGHVLQLASAARSDQAAEAAGGRLADASWVVAPIQVEARPWGLVVAGQDRGQLPADAHPRLVQFAGLLATVIANAESRSALAASRARVVAAADEARRRIERDLHDGAQQRLVTLALQVRAAQAEVPADLGHLQEELARIGDGLTGLLEELRTLARGIHPAVLDAGGLEPAIKALVRRSAVPVELDARIGGRLSERVEIAAYYVVSEALTNAAKHAQATSLQVSLAVRDNALHVAVRDDGVGGADPARGSGLVGLDDRVEALGGSMTVDSRPGAGTSLRVELPLTDSPDRPA